MCRIVFSLLLLCSCSVLAKGDDFIDEVGVTPLQVCEAFDEHDTTVLTDIPDLIGKNEKILACVTDYVTRQSKSYAKIVQNNLYDLLRNFDRIASKVYGKKPATDQISYDEKVEALAYIQCETYYALGALK